MGAASGPASGDASGSPAPSPRASGDAAPSCPASGRTRVAVTIVTAGGKDGGKHQETADATRGSRNEVFQQQAPYLTGQRTIAHRHRAEDHRWVTRRMMRYDVAT